MFNAIKDGVLVFDLKGQHVDVNPAFCSMTGFTREELLASGQPPHPYWSTEESDSIQQAFQRAHEGEIGSIELLFRKKNEERFNAVVCPATMVDENGQAKFLIATVKDDTARMRMEVSLAESEVKYRSLVETTETGYMILDAKGKVVDANNEYIGLSGHSSLEEIVGRSPVEWTAPQDAERYQAEVAQTFDRGTLRALEVHYINRLKLSTPVEVNARVVNTREGKRMLALCRNITERKQYDRVFIENEKRTQAIIDAALDAVITIDAIGKITSWNHQAELIFGWTADEAIGQKLTEMIIPSTLRQRHTLGFDRFLKTGETVVIGKRIEINAIRKSGEEFAVELTVSSFNFNGLQYFSAFIRDITTKKQAEAALIDTSNRLRLAVKAGSVGLWSWDLNTNEVFFSPEWKAQIGYEDHELDNSYSAWAERLHPDDLETTQSSLKAALDPPWPVHRVEFRLRHKNGNYRWILAHGSVEFDKNNKPSRVLGTHLDVTDRKITEDRIRKSLIEKEVLLKEIHHRVKNNMQIISGLLDLQGDLADNKKLTEIFAGTKNRISAMALVHEKLYQSPDLTRINFRDYLENLISMLTDSTGTKHHILTDIDLVQLSIDYALPCGLIINELISNAIKHAFPNRANGIIRVKLKEIANNSYELSVADDGVGFIQTNKNGKSLGLKIINALTRQINGKLTTGSSSGTTVLVSFSAQ